MACDPYFSIWSAADALNEANTVHWTGKPHRLTAIVRIDDVPYRLMGADPNSIPPLHQIRVNVLPTRTVYTFRDAGVQLTLTFLTPALPDDLDVLSRPVTYVTFALQSVDGQTHRAQLYFDASGELTVDTPNQQVEFGSDEFGDVLALRVGSRDQAVLAKRGDDIRIDWGYLYLAARKSEVTDSALAERQSLQRAFVEHDKSLVSAAGETADSLAAALTFDLPPITDQVVSRWILLAYDDLYSIQYMKQNLRPYWRRNGWQANQLLQASADEYDVLHQKCAAFDEQLMRDLTEAGGDNYAALASLAYRQCFAAGKFVADDHGQPLQFCKENHSNGCIGTSDVFYPMAPTVLAVRPHVDQVLCRTFHELCRLRTLEVPLRSARPGPVSARQRSALRRRRGICRKPNARGRKWQSAAADGGDRADGGTCRLCKPVLASVAKVGGVSQGQRV